MTLINKVLHCEKYLPQFIPWLEIIIAHSRCFRGWVHVFLLSMQHDIQKKFVLKFEIQNL